MIFLDENIADHPKFVDLSDAAFGLWVRCLCHCRRGRTDGFIPETVARRLHRGEKKLGSVLEELTNPPPSALDLAPLWTRTGGGFVMHDYLDWNPSRADVAAERERKREAGRIGGKRSGEARSKQAASDIRRIRSTIHDPRSTIHDPDQRAPSELVDDEQAEEHFEALPEPEPPPRYRDPAGIAPPGEDPDALPPVVAPAGAKSKKPAAPDLDSTTLEPVEQAAMRAILEDETLRPIVPRPAQLARDLVGTAPGVDVALEIRRAGAWLRANPNRKKSQGSRFLLSWLVRAQERAPRRQGPPTAAPGPVRVPGRPEPPPMGRPLTDAELDALRAKPEPSTKLYDVKIRHARGRIESGIGEPRDHEILAAALAEKAAAEGTAPAAQAVGS